MYKKDFKFWPKQLLKLNYTVLLRSYPNYQPIFKGGSLKQGSDRNCLDRWELIKKEIVDHNAKSFLDLGSAEGFYVLQAAKECGCVSLGVDADVRRLAVADNQLILEKIGSAGFFYGLIDEEFLEKIPSFDAVIFMSVMHHIMYSKGEEYSRKILKKIRSRVNKFLIFEMGQSDELKNKWAKRLPDMGGDPHKWIADFILSCGFSKVEKIGESDSYQKDKRRAIFKAEP
jgi:cyclopropane fatty-acyl-phospholipid synthase-like methyltransferase